MSKKIQSRTRRGNHEGGISQRKDGRWVGTITIGHDENGKQKRKSVYGRTRMEVVDKMSKISNRVTSNNFEYVENSTIGEMMSEWLLVFKKNLVSPRTFEHTFRNFKLHILPKVGNMKIDEVNNVVIQKVLNEMINDGYSLAVVRKIKFIFNQFFEYAIENNFTTNNPTRLTKVRSVERKVYDSENKYKAIPPEAREQFLTCLNSHKFLKPLCMCMMFAGLRTGEALALTWGDVDFENKKIIVRRAITIIPKFNAEGKVIARKTVISETKTACSVREVPMPDILIEALKDYKYEREIESDERKIDFVANNSLVFGNNENEIRTYSGTKKIFYDFLKRNNLNNLGIHFHGLRHTYSNMLFEADQNPKVIQALLGHKSVKTTITTYNSVDKSYFKKATDVLNRQFKPKEIISKQNSLNNFTLDGIEPAKQEQSYQTKTELDDDELEAELERLLKLKEQRQHKHDQDFEM